jgi:hypothetical protein
MIGSDVLLHIGYHKTGTTFLQHKVFPEIDANLLVMPQVDYVATCAEFDPQIFVAQLNNKSKNNRYALTILSQETLSGRGDGNPMWDPHLIAKRLKLTFPNAKILITIRNQFDYILSLYAFRVVRRGLEHRSLEQFLEEKQQWLIHKLQYDRLIGDYIRLFGAERVLVLPFEQLAADGSGFIKETLTFIGCETELEIEFGKVNPSTRNGRLLQTHRIINTPINTIMEAGQQNNIISQIQYSRLANGYFYLKRKLLNRVIEPFVPTNDYEIKMPIDWVNKLAPIFAASNVRLQNLININLPKWHYPFPN